MKETINFTLSDNTVLSVQSRECATLKDCIKDIDPALAEIKNRRGPLTDGHIKYLTEIGMNIASDK